MNIMSFFIFFCLIFSEVDEEMEEAVEKRVLPCTLGATCPEYVRRPNLFMIGIVESKVSRILVGEV